MHPDTTSSRFYPVYTTVLLRIQISMCKTFFFSPEHVQTVLTTVEHTHSQPLALQQHFGWVYLIYVASVAVTDDYGSI